MWKEQDSSVRSVICGFTVRNGAAMGKSLYDYCIEREAFHLLTQWDKDKNSGLTPHDISYGSHKKVWWKCAHNHRWDAPMYSRTGAGSGCPYCSGKKLLPFAKTLASEFPELVKEWHPAKNVGLSPNEVPPATHRKVWWICEKGHEWQAQINARTRGTGCPVCTNKKVVVGVNDLATTHPEIAAQWHPVKNGGRTPQSVVYGNHGKVWWQCEKGHEWQASIISRTGVGAGCPVCAGKLVVSGQNDLASQKPHLAAQWHPVRNGTLTPQEVTLFSNRSVWWLCEKGHEYRAAVAQRSQSETDCPYCKNRKVLAGFNDLATVEPSIAAQWHPELNGPLTPQKVTVGSHKKVWWQCEDGHAWKAVVYSRTGSKKTGCPVCAGRFKEANQIDYADLLTQKKR